MSDKKVLTILLASPRKNGNSEAMADATAGAAEAKGWQVRKLRLAAMNLKGCLDCRKCWSMDKPCIQNDDMSKVYEAIEAASVLVFATPVYYYSWPTQMKPVFDRLLPYGMPNAERGIEGKKVILLAAAGDDNDEPFESMKTSFRQIAKYVKWDIVGEVYARGIYHIGDMVAKGTKFLEEAKAIGEKL